MGVPFGLGQLTENIAYSQYGYCGTLQIKATKQGHQDGDERIVGDWAYRRSPKSPEAFTKYATMYSCYLTAYVSKLQRLSVHEAVV